MPGPPPPGPPPGPRAVLDEAGRERLLSLLREHYARGHLDLDEMSRRVGLVLAAGYADQAVAAVTDLPLLGAGSAGPGAAPARASRPGQRRRHAQQAEPDASWVPTPERFRDPSTRAIMRVWIDPADLSRHYVPEPGG
jgi:hypothetical protein